MAVRGGKLLKNEKAGGGLGGSAQRLPRRCIGCPCARGPEDQRTRGREDQKIKKAKKNPKKILPMQFLP